ALQRRTNFASCTLAFGLAQELTLPSWIADPFQEGLHRDRVRLRATGTTRSATSSADRTRELCLAHLRAALDSKPPRFRVELGLRPLARCPARPGPWRRTCTALTGASSALARGATPGCAAPRSRPSAPCPPPGAVVLVHPAS